jgi:hypothetical protein
MSEGDGADACGADGSEEYRWTVDLADTEPFWRGTLLTEHWDRQVLISGH